MSPLLKGGGTLHLLRVNRRCEIYSAGRTIAVSSLPSLYQHEGPGGTGPIMQREYGTADGRTPWSQAARWSLKTVKRYLGAS